MSSARRRPQDPTARADGGTVTNVAAPLVLDRYALQRRLGTGAFGTVWMARDERLERDVAVKILARELISDGRFEREARAAARLSHPGIVTLYEASVDDEGAYLVSELVRGETLGALLAEGRLSDRDVLEIGVGLCDALGHAHEQGVVHRDVKPSNVLVPTRGRSTRTPCKLTDFGVARVIDSDSLTLTGDVIGTLNYMAPEQAAGLEAGEPADLYSVALVLYEALSGVNPLRASGWGGSHQRHGRLAMRMPPLRRQRRDLPGPMAAAIDRALQPRVEDRGTLAELRDGLASGVELAGTETGVVTSAFERHPDEPSPPGVAARLFAPRDPSPAPAMPPPPLPDADPSRLAWQARALGGAGAAASAAWLDHVLLAAGGAPAVPVALAALIGGGLTLLLPRLGFIAIAVYVCAAAVIQGATGLALLVALLALAPMVLLPAAPALWSLAAAAPTLGFAGLAGAWPALAGWAHRPWRRATLGAVGWLWLELATTLAGRTLYEPLPPGTHSRARVAGSPAAVVDHVLRPLAHSGQLAGVGVWALAAALLPWLVRRRRPLLDLALAAAWSAAIVLTLPVAIAGLAPTRSAPVAGTAIAGAVAAAVFALGPSLVVALRHALPRPGGGGGVP